MGRLYDEKLAAYVGQESERVEGVDEVSAPMIRHWVEVMQDTCPAYTDPGWAAASRHGGIVAPAAMLQAWTLDPLWPERKRAPMPLDGVLAALEEAGYTQVVATEQRQRYGRPARPGDRVAFTMRVTDVSAAEHKTSLGLAYYVTVEYRFVNQDDDLLGTQTFKIMKYKSPADSRAVFQG